jgi:peptidyl-prolyl cis-trans isomerase C
MIAKINGIPINAADDIPDNEEIRRRACSELLRQAAQRSGLLSMEDTPGGDGVISCTASNAIEALLEKELTLSEPTEENCQRYYLSRRNDYHSTEKIHARHILFAVTDGMNVTALRKRAEAALLAARCLNDADGFVKMAQELSNCPTGLQGGGMGWLTADDCAPEFARELFGRTEVGVLPRLVHSRFGLHIVEVLQREPGVIQPFSQVQGAVLASLRQSAYVSGLRQYLHVLAEQAEVEGVDFAPG